MARRRILHPLLAAATILPLMWFNLPGLDKYAERTDLGDFTYGFVTTDSMGTTVTAENSVGQMKLARAISAYPEF